MKAESLNIRSVMNLPLKRDLCIRLEIDNWFLRLFAPHVDAEYEMSTGHLLRYDGISNLSDASGALKKVIVTYSY